MMKMKNQRMAKMGMTYRVERMVLKGKRRGRGRGKENTRRESLAIPLIVKVVAKPLVVQVISRKTPRIPRYVTFLIHLHIRVLPQLLFFSFPTIATAKVVITMSKRIFCFGSPKLSQMDHQELLSQMLSLKITRPHDHRIW